MSNFYKTNIILEYDPETEIVFFSSKEKLHIQTIDEIDYLHGYVVEYVQKIAADKKVYLLMDLDKIIINPTLEKNVTENTKIFYDKYLYPDGVASFGRSISRITFKMGIKKILDQPERIFTTEQEARDFLSEVRELNNSRSMS